MILKPSFSLNPRSCNISSEIQNIGLSLFSDTQFSHSRSYGAGIYTQNRRSTSFTIDSPASFF